MLREQSDGDLPLCSSSSLSRPLLLPENSWLRQGDSAPPASAQLRKETKQSYANLRSLLQKYDKGEEDPRLSAGKGSHLRQGTISEYDNVPVERAACVKYTSFRIVSRVSAPSTNDDG